MKTFFFALILGIFIGAALTSYYNSPESFEALFQKTSDKISSAKNSETGQKIAEQAKESAENIAEEVKEGVKNLVEETKDEREALVDTAKDAGIKTAILGKLKLDSAIDASRIQVEVENGSVVLSGEIASRAEERKARDIALDTRYVKDVTSNLQIAP